MAEKVSRSEAIAFRLGAQNPRERTDASGLVDVTGRCGIQNSPPGSALLALHVRVQDITRQQVDEAVAEDKSLVQTWCMRGAPCFIPAADAPAFTTGVLPPTEGAMRHFLLGAGQDVDRVGMSLGTWRPRITVRTFGALSSRHRTGVQDEAEQIAPLRDASSVSVEFDTH